MNIETNAASPASEAAPQDGVTENSQAPAGGSADTSGEGTPAKEEMVSRLEYNKARETERKLQKELQRLQGDFKNYQGAKALHERLSQDPRAAKLVQDLMQGKFPGQEEKNLYEGYDDLAVSKFKELDEIKQWKAAQEQKEQQQRMQNVERSMETLDSSFDRLLTEKGFMDKDGKGDASELNMLSKATLAVLAEKFGDPRTVTEAQLKEAFEDVQAGLAAYEKRTLKKTVKQTVPLSGSNRGETPGKKAGPKTDEERWREMASMLEQ